VIHDGCVQSVLVDWAAPDFDDRTRTLSSRKKGTTFCDGDHIAG
jgi:hypothetical protein